MACQAGIPNTMASADITFCARLPVINILDPDSRYRSLYARAAEFTHRRIAGHLTSVPHT